MSNDVLMQFISTLNIIPVRLSPDFISAVRYPSLRTKELYELTIRTVYPRLIVGTEDKKGCQCIGYNDRDYLFVNRRDAVDLFKSIKADIEEENDNG